MVIGTQLLPNIAPRNHTKDDRPSGSEAEEDGDDEEVDATTMKFVGPAEEGSH